MGSAGRLIGMARRDAPRAPMEMLDRAVIGVDCGVDGDCRGRSKRQVTVIAREAWEAACAELGQHVPWTARRANLLVEGFALPRRPGEVFAIGDVRLEVMVEVDPCFRMDEAAPGLQEALRPEWRGGYGCRVLRGGEVTVGDPVWIEEASQ